jgi:hypothetical protein
MNTYRIFISYSRQDLELVRKIIDLLKKNGLIPMWDENFVFGSGFHEQIKTFIAHSHVFLPVITETSTRRGWVHQEIGYATALNIPVLPVTIGKLPGEMLQELHAVRLNKDLTNLDHLLSREVFENLIKRYQESSLAFFQCAELTEDRAMMMAKLSENILNLGKSGCVRQKGALSSFHIPDKLTTDIAWKKRYGNSPKGQFLYRLLREERLVLERHARASGCRLIITPSVDYAQYGAEARKVRLETLVEFLQVIPDDLVQVALNPQTEEPENVTIVGDWFAAESVSGSLGQGYRQTIFTRHAPTIWKKIDLFDQEMHDLHIRTGWAAESSRVLAIDRLNAIIAEIEQDLPPR